MRKSQLKEHIKLLLRCLPILIVCAVIQFASFSGWIQKEIENRYYVMVYDDIDTYEQAEQIKAYIIEIYGERLAEFEVREDTYHRLLAEYKIDQWFNNPPILTNLLSLTTNTPLIISTIILLVILIIMLVERDYRPNKSVLTILRLPRSRSRYILEKLVSPAALMFLFWGIQYLVAILQTNHYFAVVPEALRPSNQSPWTFDYYRTLYPVTEPIWFLATACALCMIPLAIVTIVFIAKGGMKSWVYGILPAVGAVAVVLVINRIPNMWWIMPVLLISVYLNCKMLFNKGQIVP